MTDTQDSTVDVVVIGAGPVGENVADRVVRGGMSAIIVERELVGGECSYWACIPSKALLRDPAAVRAARALPAAGKLAAGSLDATEVLRRRSSFTSDWHDSGQVDWLNNAGITLVRGDGRLTGPRTVTVTGPGGEATVLHARHAVVLATGSGATLPPIDGLDTVTPWTSREATAAEQIPARLAIIGGGVVGAEMATAYTGLGAEVTIIVRGKLLASVDDFAGEQVADALRKAGAQVYLDTGVTAAERTASGEVRLTLSDGQVVTTDEVLVATGRRPHTQDLGLETIGLTPGDWLTVNAALAVLDADGKPFEGEWLYAAGDVNKRVLLTHQGKYQARALGDAIVARANGERVDLAPWGRHAVTADERAVPQVIFTDPEVAAVGRTAATAAAAGIETRVVDYDLGSVAGAALHADGYRGKARMIVDNQRNVLVGFTVVGQDVGEMLQAATIAIVGEVPIDRLWHAVPAFPTMSEVWLRLLESDDHRQ